MHIDIDQLISLIAGLALVSAPLTSYMDTLVNIYRSKSSAGFSIDVCAIMLLSSILRVYFYLSKPYELSLFLQAFVMIGMHLALLKLALDYRPRKYLGGPLDIGLDDDSTGSTTTASSSSAPGGTHKAASRPFKFWQWRSSAQYWKFLVQYTVFFGILQVLFGSYPVYYETIGLVGLLVESVLPLPQIIVNYRRSSVDGFRMSLLLSWLGGDVSKIGFFLYSDNINFQFQLCAIIQASLDLFIGIQYIMYSKKLWSGSAAATTTVNRQRAESIKLQGIQQEKTQ